MNYPMTDGGGHLKKKLKAQIQGEGQKMFGRSPGKPGWQDKPATYEKMSRRYQTLGRLIALCDAKPAEDVPEWLLLAAATVANCPGVCACSGILLGKES